MEIVLNKSFGELNLSEDVLVELECGARMYGYGFADSIEVSNETFGIISNNSKAYRSHPRLIEAIKKVGLEKATFSPDDKLLIITVPDGIQLVWLNHDGIEFVVERGHIWG